MPTLKELENTDERYNPSESQARSLLAHEKRTGQDAGVNAGIDQAEQFANDPKNASGRNIDSAREAENQFNYEHSGGTNQTSKKRFTFSAKGLKKKGPLGLLIGLLLGGVGGISMLLTPGMAAIQMKEILTDDLNDQLAAMDIRSTYVMRAKLNDMGRGVCNGIQIRCGFKGMSDRQIRKFKAAGIEVKTDGKVFGRNHVTKLIVKTSDGRSVEIDNPRQLNRLLGDRLVRNAVRKAFNPKFAGFFDDKWDDFKSRYNLTSGDKIGSGTDEEKRSAVTSAVEGDPATFEGQDRVPTTDEDGKVIEGASDQNESIDRANQVDGEGVSTKSLLSSGGSSAVKGIGLLGAADVACTVKNTSRAVEAGAKIWRYRQLMAYASVFLTFADHQKASGILGPDAVTPEQAEFVGNTLTAIDTDKMTITEDSVLDGNENPQPVENPYYGANAFDSAGYKVAQYNEAPTLSARDMQMAVGGGIALGVATEINDFLAEHGAEGSCEVIQSWAVRGASIVAGIIVGVGTLGMSTVLSVGASAAIGMALPILENYLAQMIGGTVVDGDTDGVDAGNAMFAGSAALMGGMAMTRGMKPATKSDLQEYMALTDEVQSEYIAMETEEAKATPFDVTNRYSFMGSLTRSLLPLRTTSSISVGESISNSLSAVSSIVMSPLKANAASSYNPDRFSKCSDSGYEEINIDADVFCNVRYTMSSYELGLETEEVRVQMFNWQQVDEGGDPIEGSDYDKWLEECTRRDEAGWGETDQENNEGKGARCMKTEKRDSYYRVYTMDDSIIEAMDYVPPTAGSNTESEDGDTTFSGDFAWPVDQKWYQADKLDFLGPHFANSGTWTNGVDSLAADVGSPPDGSPVYAMFGGRVTGASLGGHGLIISTPIQGGVLEIAYAHGPRTSNATSYKAGDKIMTVGCLGNCSGGHVHIDIAFNDKGVCPQDIFLAFEKNQVPNFAELTKKAAAPCGREPGGLVE